MGLIYPREMDGMVNGLHANGILDNNAVVYRA